MSRVVKKTLIVEITVYDEVEGGSIPTISYISSLLMKVARLVDGLGHKVSDFKILSEKVEDVNNEL